MDIKNALYNDNGELVQKRATELLNQSTGLNETHMKKSLEELTKGSNLKDQRKNFATFSKELYTIYKETGVNEKTLYWFHCSMALEGEGANWLSLIENIENPYLGKQMSTCGSVKEILK